MTRVTLADADALHSCFVHGSFTWETLEHAVFERFSLDVAAFLKDASGREDAHTNAACRDLKAIRSAFTISVEPFHRCGDLIPPRRDALEYSASVMKEILGTDPAVRSLTRALASLDELVTSTDNPLGDRVADIASRHTSGRLALVCPKASAVTAAQDYFGGRAFAPQLDVVVPSELAKHPAFDVIILLGTPYWYRGYEHVLNVPRAEHLHMMQWAWVNCIGIPERTTLVGGRTGADRPVSAPSPPAARRDAHRVDEDEVAEVTNWVDIRARRPTESRPSDNHDDVEALLLALADDRAVYLDAFGKQQEVVEPDLDGEERIQKKDSAELTHGDHILLRTEGGGSLIRVAADEILGSHAVSLRIRQSEWKRRLRAKRDDIGNASLIRELKAAGCTIAKYQNIRNWASPDSIKLRNEEHFRALLQVIGLEHHSEYWEWMKMIDSAHRKAGRVLARELREAVRDADMDTLVRSGRMRFTFGSDKGGELEIFRVEDVDAETHVVPEQLLGHPFPIHGERIWAETDGDSEG